MNNKENVKEFTKSDSITLTMPFNPELVNMMREWYLSVPTLYMLDICVVSATKLKALHLKLTLEKPNL